MLFKRLKMMMIELLVHLCHSPQAGACNFFKLKVYTVKKMQAVPLLASCAATNRRCYWKSVSF